jgi:hypothetical protein
MKKACQMIWQAFFDSFLRLLVLDFSINKY